MIDLIGVIAAAVPHAATSSNVPDFTSANGINLRSTVQFRRSTRSMIEAVVMDFKIEGEVGTTSFGTSAVVGFLIIARKFEVENSVTRWRGQRDSLTVTGTRRGRGREEGLTIDVGSSCRVEMQSNRVTSLSQQYSVVCITSKPRQGQ